MWKLSALIADDDELMHQLLKVVVTELGGDVVAEASDGLEAVSAYVKHRPHLVLLDINMPKMSGVDALREIKTINPKACVIMLTSENSVETVKACIRSGACAYVLKTNPPELLASGIEDGWRGYIDQITGVCK